MIDKELLRKLLKPYTNGIDSGEIYAHGYPESRLIPSNHTDFCNGSFAEYVEEELMKVAIKILDEHFLD